MKTIAVIFGGKSVEHDISIITGTQAIESAQLLYRVVPIYITKSGQFLTGQKLCNIKNFENFSKKGCKPCYFSTDSKRLFVRHGMLITSTKIDACLLCLHGQNGEDGAIQGMLTTAGIPFSGCDVCASAVTFDKVICKNLLIANGIPTPNFVCFFKDEFELNRAEVIEKISKLHFPVIVKPARLGSSVGVSKCNNKKELEYAIDFALNFDLKIIVEKALSGFFEVNVSVLKDNDGVKCSAIEKIENKNQVFSFEDKYINGNVKHNIGVELNQDCQKQVLDFAKQAFVCCGCDGVVRVDFLIDKNGAVFVNEINAIPGSLAFYLWKQKGYGMASVINKLIFGAIKKEQQKQQLNYTLNTKAVVEFSKVKNTKMHK